MAYIYTPRKRMRITVRPDQAPLKIRRPVKLPMVYRLNDYGEYEEEDINGAALSGLGFSIGGAIRKIGGGGGAFSKAVKKASSKITKSSLAHKLADKTGTVLQNPIVQQVVSTGAAIGATAITGNPLVGAAVAQGIKATQTGDIKPALSSTFAVAGGYAGGPTGAMIGGNIGNALTGGQITIPTDYGTISFPTSSPVIPEYPMNNAAVNPPFEAKDFIAENKYVLLGGAGLVLFMLLAMNKRK